MVTTPQTPQTPPAPQCGVGPDAESRDWVDGLTRADVGTQQQLHVLLVRAARSEVGRRAHTLAVSGAEIDDLAHQCAADAMVSILRKLDTFRGESRFTTWAYKFVIFEASGKVSRHFWTGPSDPLESEQWERLPDRLGVDPEDAAEAAELFAAVRDAVDTELTERQRDAFVAVVVNGVPVDVVAGQWGTNRNALYKTIFDARRKIRARLVTNGYLEGTT